MNTETQQLLNAVLAERAPQEKPMQPPLSAERRQAFEQRVTQIFGYALPEAYLDVLAASDGLDWNGIKIYASELYAQGEVFIHMGFVEANVQLRQYEPNRDFIYFADSGMDAYRHNLVTNEFEVSDRVGGTVFDSFATAEELFAQVFNHMLGNYGDEDDSEPDN